jgi:PPOX class probable F420-dependent enzyme
MELDEKALNIINGKNFGFIATVSKDGYPHVTPLWVDTDGENLIINTSKGRKKLRNLERDSRVAVAVQNHENPYNYVLVIGKVSNITENGAVEHIDKLAKKYRGLDQYPGPRVDRVMVIIKPERVFYQG